MDHRLHEPLKTGVLHDSSARRQTYFTGGKTEAQRVSMRSPRARRAARGDLLTMFLLLHAVSQELLPHLLPSRDLNKGLVWGKDWRVFVC